MSEGGTLAFTELSAALHLWKVSDIYTQGSAVLTKLTQEADIDICPNTSPNGRWLVFLRGLEPQRHVWVRDTKSLTESVLNAPQSDKFSPIIDDSGGMVVFEAKDAGIPSIFVLGPDHVTTKLCSACSNPTGWFMGRVLYRSGDPSGIMMVEPKPGAAPVSLLAKPGWVLAEANWSSANQYLLFTASSGGARKQIFAMHLPPNGEATTGNWVPITNSSEWADKPRWSQDGKMIFYLSERDGYTCLWAQHFNPASGEIDGPPSAVMHFHNARISPGRVLPRSLSLAVSFDAIYLNLGETTGSIWTATLKRSYAQRLLRWFW
jgi:hypothetical protein